MKTFSSLTDSCRTDYAEAFAVVTLLRYHTPSVHASQSHQAVRQISPTLVRKNIIRLAGGGRHEWSRLQIPSELWHFYQLPFGNKCQYTFFIIFLLRQSSHTPPCISHQPSFFTTMVSLLVSVIGQVRHYYITYQLVTPLPSHAHFRHIH